MDPISNVDRLVLLLRQRLEARAKKGASTAGPSVQQPNTPMDGVQALAGVDGVDDRQLGRALIQSVLVEQFGQAVMNDAKFQQVVDRVTETLEEDPGGSGLLGRLVAELRASAR
jgi:hypothetical protein